jgi:hypothetical protein
VFINLCFVFGSSSWMYHLHGFLISSHWYVVVSSVLSLYFVIVEFLWALFWFN